MNSAAIDFRFCSVFYFKRKLYIGRQLAADGPRKLVMPPKLLDSDVSRTQLGEEIRSALDDFSYLGRSIPAEEWEALNEQLLDFFGEKTVAAFERKKRNVTVRLEEATGEVQLFGPRSSNEVFQRDTDWASIANAACRMLKIKLRIPDG